MLVHEQQKPLQGELPCRGWAAHSRHMEWHNISIVAVMHG